MAHRHIPGHLRRAARRLRSEMTDAERRLWYRLRAHRFDDWGFRRQAPIGSYIVDFVSHSARLIIEIDGGQHNHSATDMQRQAWLERRGYRVLRFWNHDVLKQTDSVLAVIGACSATTRPPPARRRFAPAGDLPRKGGGEEEPSRAQRWSVAASCHSSAALSRIIFLYYPQHITLMAGRRPGHPGDGAQPTGYAGQARV
jgi:very-short-patch-repair endonuclease